MAADQIFDDFADDLDISESKVLNYPQLILLCGGEISRATAPQHSIIWKLKYAISQYTEKIVSPKKTSLRDVLYSEIREMRPILFNRILLAEDIFNKFDQSPYPDLLVFERDLAHLCSLTVVIAESAGSIAELGAFALLHNVSAKTLVVIDEYHYDRKSFIRRGPVEHIRQKNNSRIQSYKWLKNEGIGPIDRKSVADFSRYLLDEIEKQSAVSELAAFDTSNDGHCMYCILEILKTFQVATGDDIVKFLRRIGNGKEEKIIKRYLGLLQCFDFVGKKRYGHYDYYYTTSSEKFVKWAYKSTARYNDSIRWSKEFREEYKRRDPKRLAALRTILRGTN